MNNNSNLVVLFDSTSDFDDLDETISNSKSKIISFDYETHKILNDKKINHEVSDSYLSREDLRTIQKKPGEYEEIRTKADKPVLIVIPKNVSAAHINVNDGVSRILALADISWKPNDGEMKNVSFNDYDWNKWKKN